MSGKERQDGKGSVYQRDDGKWVAQVRYFDDFTGKSRKVRRYAKTRDAARELLKQLLEDPEPDAARAPGSETLADYLTRWTKTSLKRAGDLSPNTKVTYKNIITAYAVPASGELPLVKFDAEHAERWVERLQQRKKRNGEPIAPSTVVKTYRAVNRALDTAVRDKQLRENPLRQIAKPSATKVAVPVTSEAEADRLLLKVKGKRIEPIVVFVMFTGCRIGEALALQWDQVNLSEGTATIRVGSPTRATTKNSKVRTVTLLPEVVDQLKATRRRQNKERIRLGAGWPNTGLVFTTETGQPVRADTARRDLKRYLEQAEVATERPWHALRHGIAHRLLKRGVPLHTVSAILGHSGIQVTADVYGHIEATVPVEVLSAALGRS